MFVKSGSFFRIATRDREPSRRNAWICMNFKLNLICGSKVYVLNKTDTSIFILACNLH